jgi:cytochrome P450
VLKEAMRLIPPVYMVGRRIREDMELEGHRFRKGQTVLINIVGIHRRADLYAEPERFDPDRWVPEREKQLPRQGFMPFGAGPRVCVGNHFAWMEAQLVLATWMQRLRCELESERMPEFEPLITLRPRGGIRMRVSARSAQATVTHSALPGL